MVMTVSSGYLVAMTLGAEEMIDVRPEVAHIGQVNVVVKMMILIMMMKLVIMVVMVMIMPSCRCLSCLRSSQSAIQLDCSGLPKERRFH